MASSPVKNKLLKAISGFILICVIGLIVLELAFRIIQFAWPPVYQLCFDNRNKIYLYSIGESTAAGRHYSAKISPAQLVSYQFNDSLQGKPIEIIQLAKAGSLQEYQYFNFFFEVLLRPHKNGLVLIYSGINESSGNCAANKDFSFWKILQSSIVLSKLYYIYRSNNNCPQKFEYRYHQFSQLAKKHHFKMVVSQLVGNVASYDPEISSDNTLLSNKNKDAFNSAISAMAIGEYKQADSLWTLLQNKIRGENALLLFCRGRCKYQLGEYDSASVFLNRAPEISSYLGFAQWKNRIIERVAAEENIPIAHTFERFRDSSEHQLIGYDLIDDAHHPNVKGYCLMADEMSRQVSVLYNESIKNHLNSETVATHFKFDRAFYADAYYSLVEWYIFECVETQERELRIARTRYYLTKYEDLDSTNPKIILWKGLISVLENNKDGFVENFSRFDYKKQGRDLWRDLWVAFQDKPAFKTELKSIVQKWHLQPGDEELRVKFIAALNRTAE